MIGGLIGMLAAALAAAGTAPSAPASSPPAGATASTAPLDNDPLHKVECRRIEETGSRLGGKRVCMTRQEWLDISREARTMTEDVQARGSAAKTPGF